MCKIDLSSRYSLTIPPLSSTDPNNSAWDAGGEFAVKIVNKKLLEKGPAAVRMEREIQVLSLLSHPNIAQLFEVIDTDTHKYVDVLILPLFWVFVLLDGGEMCEFLCKFPFHNDVC